MTVSSRQSHWDTVYASREETGLSWFQEKLDVSVNWIRREAPMVEAAIIDVGGGTSRLVDILLEPGRPLSVLDISSKALAISQMRLGARAEHVEWICADVTVWKPSTHYWLWHDRAVFHFLTEARDRAAYIETMRRAVLPGGRVIIASFSLEGPEKCSNLPVRRYSHESLAQELGTGFELLEGVWEDHRTPSGAIQKFQYTLFARSV
ncbi:MAG: class I SAM-dependent methyltransferase [Magnetococcales bacterium]|nr:class I SAM-dependent methyltransferase [Magnetococcales bacterium]